MGGPEARGADRHRRQGGTVGAQRPEQRHRQSARGRGAGQGGRAGGAEEVGHRGPAARVQVAVRGLRQLRR